MTVTKQAVPVEKPSMTVRSRLCLLTRREKKSIFMHRSCIFFIAGVLV